MRKRTPQQKKALSYVRDCRNTYGESDKGARKSIRRNKTIQNQIYRRKINRVLSEIDNAELENAELIDVEAKSIARGRWKKCSDTPLKLFIELQKDMRERRVGRKTRGTLKQSRLSVDFINRLKERK